MKIQDILGYRLGYLVLGVLALSQILGCGSDKDLDEWKREKLAEDVSKFQAANGVYGGWLTAKNSQVKLGALEVELQAQTTVGASDTVKADQKPILVTKLKWASENDMVVVVQESFYDPDSGQYQATIPIQNSKGETQKVALSGIIKDGVFDGTIEAIGYGEYGGQFRLTKDQKVPAAEFQSYLSALSKTSSTEESDKRIAVLDGATQFRGGNTRSVKLIVMKPVQKIEGELLDQLHPVRTVNLSLIYSGGQKFYFPNAEWDRRSKRISGTIKVSVAQQFQTAAGSGSSAGASASPAPSSGSSSASSSTSVDFGISCALSSDLPAQNTDLISGKADQFVANCDHISGLEGPVAKSTGLFRVPLEKDLESLSPGTGAEAGTLTRVRLFKGDISWAVAKTPGVLALPSLPVMLQVIEPSKTELETVFTYFFPDTAEGVQVVLMMGGSNQFSFRSAKLDVAAHRLSAQGVTITVTNLGVVKTGVVEFEGSLNDEGHSLFAQFRTAGSAQGPSGTLSEVVATGTQPQLPDPEIEKSFEKRYLGSGQMSQGQSVDASLLVVNSKKSSLEQIYYWFFQETEKVLQTTLSLKGGLVNVLFSQTRWNTISKTLSGENRYIKNGEEFILNLDCNGFSELNQTGNEMACVYRSNRLANPITLKVKLQ